MVLIIIVDVLCHKLKFSFEDVDSGKLELKRVKNFNDDKI